MNTTLDTFLNQLKARLPNVDAKIDCGLAENAPYWIDLSSKENTATIEYRPASGFGLYTAQVAEYGTRPSEIYRTLEPLLIRLRKHFESSSSSSLSLRDLRELRSTTQEALAHRTGKKQSAISRLEGRDDLLVATLVEFVVALGGTVQINVHFDEFDAPLSIAKTDDNGRARSATKALTTSQASHNFKSGVAPSMYTAQMSAPPHRADFADVRANGLQSLIGKLLLNSKTVIWPLPRAPAAMRAADIALRWEFDLGATVGRLIVTAFLEKQKLLIQPRIIGNPTAYSMYFVRDIDNAVIAWPSAELLGMPLSTRRVVMDLDLEIPWAQSKPVLLHATRAVDP